MDGRFSSKSSEEFNNNGVFNMSPEILEDGKVNSDNMSNMSKYSIEDALKATGQGRFHLFLLFVCGFSMMGVVVENVNVGFVMPYVRCEMSISTVEQGFLNSVSYIGIVFSSHFWGFLADTAGRRRVLLISTSGSFLFAILSSSSFNIISLIIMRLLVGIFVSGTQAAMYSYIGEFHSNETRTKTLSLVAMFMPACFVYLPIVAWSIIPMKWQWQPIDGVLISPWRIYLFLSSFLNGMNFLCLLQLPESPKYLLSINRKADTLNVLERIYSINSRKDKQLYPVKDLTTEPIGTALSDVNDIRGVLKLVWNQTWPLFKKPHVGNTLKLCYLMFVLFSIGHGTFNWYPDFLSKMQSYTEGSHTLCSVVGHQLVETNSQSFSNSTSYIRTNDSTSTIELMDCNNMRANTLTFKIILMMGIVFVTISAIISFYIDKIDRKNLLISWMLICAIFSVLIALVPNFYIMAICFMIFLSCGLCGGIISAISIAIFPTNIKAMATCLILMFGRLGAVCGGNFVGLLLNGHCELIFYVYAVLILSCTFVCFYLDTNPADPPNQTDHFDTKL